MPGNIFGLTDSSTKQDLDRSLWLEHRPTDRDPSTADKLFDFDAERYSRCTGIEDN
jgi:hypothetical protein